MSFKDLLHSASSFRKFRGGLSRRCSNEQTGSAEKEYEHRNHHVGSAPRRRQRRADDDKQWTEEQKHNGKMNDKRMQ